MLYYALLDNRTWTHGQLDALNKLIDAARVLFVQAYQVAKPKMHYTAHYSDCIKLVGPITHYKCYGMESYHARVVASWRYLFFRLQFERLQDGDNRPVFSPPIRASPVNVDLWPPDPASVE